MLHYKMTKVYYCTYSLHLYIPMGIIINNILREILDSLSAGKCADENCFPWVQFVVPFDAHCKPIIQN